MADKKLFGQADDNNPPLTDKIAFGTDSNNARNMTFTNLLSWLEGKLGFFRTAKNLSEGNASEIRYNIGTYGWAEIDNKDAAKANINDVLLKNNTTVYTPAGNYNPATVKFVNDALRRTRCLQSSSYVVHSIGNMLYSNNYPVVDRFILKFTGGVANSVILPSDSVLQNSFGYTIGVVLFITVDPQSTQAGILDGQVMDQHGNEVNVLLGGADSLIVQRVPSKNEIDWLIINRFT